MTAIEYIAEIHSEATTYGVGKLTVKEREFVESVYQQSQRPGFTRLTDKQNNWLSAIARKLMNTSGKHQWEVVAERARERLRCYRSAYYAACW